MPWRPRVLCDSFVDIAELPGFVISSGGSIAASILLGKRKYAQANRVFTLSLLLALLGGILCCCLLPFCDIFGRLLTNNGAIAKDVAQYTFLTIVAAPFIGVNLVISSFAILDNHSKVAMMQVLATNATNLALDYLFMGPLGMGVAGAAAATLAGTIVGILVGLRYLLSAKRALQFTDLRGKLKETIKTIGSSSGSFFFDKGSRIASGMIVNVILIYFVGNMGVALYAIFGRLKFIIRILVGGASKTISSLGSMLYGERDFYGIRKMMSIIFRYTYMVVAAVVVVLFLLPGVFLQFFGLDAAEPGTHLVTAFRLMLLGLPVFWMNDLLAIYYPCVQKQKLSVLLFALQNLVFKILILLPCVAAANRWGLGQMPAIAVWCLLVEVLSLTVTLLCEKVKYGRISIFRAEDTGHQECHFFSIAGQPESVADIHQEIGRFCRKNDIPPNKGNLLSIAFEEAALNIIKHNEKVRSIDICLLLENGDLIVRIRDDGAPFDPLEYEDEHDILYRNNIRLLEKIADKKEYTRIMNMNNTVLSIKLQERGTV